MTELVRGEGEADTPVSILEHDGCLVISVHRPEVRNAIDHETAVLLDRAVRALEVREDFAVGVLTGSDGHFSAGRDIKAALSGQPDVLVEDRGFAGITRAKRCKPLIAAVEGYALGGGFELALACDLIVAARGARFGLPEVGLGFVAPEGGIVRLARRLPRTLAAELLLTGGRLTACRAAELGLVNRLVPDGTAVEAALELAGSIRRNAPLAVRATLQILNECDGLGERAAFRRQDALARPVFATEDSKEGYAAFSAGRPPRWTGA
jgi:enoyl-CoA hydratase